MTLHKTTTADSERVRQGDIFKGVPFFESYSEYGGNLKVVVLEFPYAIVLTQDCDLEQNKRRRAEIESAAVEPGATVSNDKHLVSVLVAPVYNFEHFIAGEHLSTLDIAAQRLNSKQKALLMTNQNPRYHYFEFERSSTIPNSVVDFKHYFSVSLLWLENKLAASCICGISPLYRELVSQRFSNYLSRIGLPEPEVGR